MNDLNLELSDIACSLLKLFAEKFSLQDYPPIVDIYNSFFKYQKILLKTGRQVSKSVTLAALQALTCLAKPGMRTLYVSNLSIQTTRFSKSYLSEFLKSDIFLDYVKADVENVHTKYFRNSSSMELSYLNESPTRVRGISADVIVYDEVQDINYDDIPIVRECLKASKYGEHEIYAGTPKTLDNTIQSLWETGTKMEWGIKCKHCGYWNIADDQNTIKMIQKYGPACIKCKKRLDVRNGEWILMEKGSGDSFIGFHLPQIVLPMHVEKFDFKKNKYIPGSFDNNLTSKWRILYNSLNTYSKTKFYNEVLGISQDVGGKVITLTELKNAAILPKIEDINLSSYDKIRVGGVDWGISAESSFTVFTILGHRAGNLHVLYAKKFMSTDILDIIKEIIQIANRYGVMVIGCDRGVGYTNNQILKENLGASKIIEYQYGAVGRVTKWSPSGKCYMLDKTTSLDHMFMNIKSRKILFPPYEEMEDYFRQILSVYEEYIEMPKRKYKVFRRNRTVPDDFAHALNFAMITAYKLMGHKLLNMRSTGIGSDL